jgi:hypothetical protein
MLRRTPPTSSWAGPLRSGPAREDCIFEDWVFSAPRSGEGARFGADETQEVRASGEAVTRRIFWADRFN